jgi:MoaA/NifB/PqqE/SkfB family radical SAM enzyme
MKYPKYFCPQPFSYVYTNHYGSWKPCCKSSIGHKPITFEEWWYEDEDLKKLRNALLSDEWSEPLEDECSRFCFNSEARGVKSYRQHMIDAWSTKDRYKKMNKLISSFKSSGHLLTDERVYQIKVRGFGNECNLKCYMCPPQNSTSRITEMLKVSDESLNMFYDRTFPKEYLINTRKATLNNEREKKQMYEVIEELGPNIRMLSLTGGEPSMISEYYDLMDKIIEIGESKNIDIFMNSNLTRFNLKNRSLIDYFSQFKSFFIQASIDDLFERDEWIRYPSKFEKVIENLKYLKTINNCKVSVNVTWSLLNVTNAENICKYFDEQNLNIAQNVNFVKYPNELHVKNHPYKNELMEKFKNSKYKMVREVGLEMKAEYDELQFFKAVAYIKELDKIRNTKSWKVFPELSSYLQ